MSVRYIGSKARVAQQIVAVAGPWPGHGRFVDAFCGTGAVARAAADRGWPVLVNDHLASATATTVASLVASDDVPMRALGGYARAIERLAGVAPREGFVWREYSPASSAHAGVERRYFTERNAAAIDGIRAEIGRWELSGAISTLERMVLVADLVAAADRVANIAGTYGCFLRDWSAQARRGLDLRPRPLRAAPTSFEVSSLDVFDLAARPHDTVYLDPPYTKRQYAAYYHVCETIAEGDAPLVGGVTGLRPWEHKASPFCYKARALPALVDLVSGLEARRVLLSYSTEGHVPLGALVRGLGTVGVVHDHRVAVIGRYRPNTQASANATDVCEHLLEIHGRDAMRRAAGRRGTARPASALA